MEYLRCIFIFGICLFVHCGADLQPVVPAVPVAPSVVLRPVSSACLACICEASSNCNLGEKCVGDVCGPYKMTWAYWVDGGRRTVNGESPYSVTAFANCANDVTCAVDTIQEYVRKFNQDCNGDGVTNCLDHVSVHYNGGYSCQKPLPGLFAQKFKHCLDHYQTM